MPDIAHSNSLLGLFGPLLILTGLGLNIVLLWASRHSLAGALLGKGIAPELRFTAAPGTARRAPADMLSFGPVPAVSPPLSVRRPAVCLAA